MAIQTQTRSAGPRLGAFPSAGDRAKAFRAALRHSWRVRMLRYALPAAALVIAGLYALPGEIKVKTRDGEATIKKVEMTGEGLKMTNPRLKGVHAKHGTYDIRAESATQNPKQPELMTLHSITADIVANNGGKTMMTAPSGLYHTKREELTFDKGLTIGGDAGLAGQMKTATAYFANHVLVSGDPVSFAFHGSTIKAEGLTYYTSEARAIFTGNVEVHLERAPKEGDKGEK